MIGTTVFGVAMVALIVISAVAVGVVITVLLVMNEKKKIFKASLEGAKIDTMLEKGQVSKSEADELKRAIGIYSTLEGKDVKADIHLVMVGILHIVNGLATSVGFLLFRSILPGLPSAEFPGFAEALALIQNLMLLFCVLDVIAGAFVIARKSWARYVVVTFSVFSLPSFPLGTAFGAYSLWALLFRQNARSFFCGGEESCCKTAGAPTKTSVSAIWSLVLGILGLSLLGPFGAIPAVICGHVALPSIKDSNGALGGRGLAVTGLVLGYVGILFMVLALLVLPALLLPAVGNARDTAQRTACMSHLKQIGLAARMYASDHDGSFPSDLQVLADEDYIQDLKIFTCPALDTEVVGAANADEWSDYVLVPNLSEDDPPDSILAFSKPRCYPGKGGNVVTLEGAVRWHDAAEYDELMLKLSQRAKESGLYDARIVSPTVFSVDVVFKNGGDLLLTGPSTLASSLEGLPAGTTPIEVTFSDEAVTLTTKLEAATTKVTMDLLEGQRVTVRSQVEMQDGTLLFADLHKPDGSTEAVGLTVVPKNE